jgi:hypothetical protein
LWVQVLNEKYTHEKKNIRVEIRVAMVLAQLGGEMFSQMYGNIYGIAESTTSIIMKEFYSTIKKH